MPSWNFRPTPWTSLGLGTWWGRREEVRVRVGVGAGVRIRVRVEVRVRVGVGVRVRVRVRVAVQTILLDRLRQGQLGGQLLERAVVAERPLQRLGFRLRLRLRLGSGLD